MNATFLKHALPAVLLFEGSYSNNPNDSGGATMKGITHTEYDAYRKAHRLPVQDVRRITDAEVADIYKTRYWDAVHGDDLPYPIDWLTFDAAVNMGPVTAIKLLEQALGDNPDGRVTPALLAQIKAKAATLQGTHSLKTAELQKRIDRYYGIVASHPHDSVFLRGWLNRVEGLRAQS